MSSHGQIEASTWTPIAGEYQNLVGSYQIWEWYTLITDQTIQAFNSFNASSTVISPASIFFRISIWFTDLFADFVVILVS